MNIKSKPKYSLLLSLLLLLTIVYPFQAICQKGSKPPKPTPVLLTLVNEQGIPVQNANVTVGEGLIVTKTNEKGQAHFNALSDAVILIESIGYEPVLTTVFKIPTDTKIALKKSLIYDNAGTDYIDLPLREKTTRRELTGAISKVSGDDLSKFPDISLGNTLQGRLMGLYVINTTSGLGNNDAELYVRGLHRDGSDQAITLVDGVERPIDFIIADEIDNVEVIKDPVTKMMYGPRAANGIILITTKRGKENTKLLQVSGEYGVSMPTRLPKYLNSYDYATLYNEARSNDGFPAFYSQQDLEGYKNSLGANDQLYPDIDFFDYFLNSSAPFTRINVNYTGGGNAARYALIVGYTSAKGFEKVGKIPSQDRINLRGNLDIEIDKNFKAFVDASGIVEQRNWSSLNQNLVFSSLNNHRPNEYPFLIADSTVGGGSVLGLQYVPPLGGSYLHPDNLYAELLYGGTSKHNYFYGQTNLGLDLGLNKILKGLSVKSVFNFDNYQFLQSGRSNTPVTYVIQKLLDVYGNDSLAYLPLRKRVDQLSDQRQGEDMTRNFGLASTLGYDNDNDVNSFKAQITHFYYRSDNRGTLQNIENTNTYLKLNYGLNKKIFIDGIVSMMGSNKFDKNKFSFFPAVGASWILSEEEFLNGTAINFLKLKSTFGILGYDRATDFYVYQSRWYNNGTYPLNQVNNVNAVPRSSLSRVGNPNIDWEKAREFEIGLEGLVIGNRLSFEFNYFNQLRYDIINSPAKYYSVLAGDLYPNVNQGRIQNNGIEGMINWQAKIGSVYFDWGANIVYSKTKVLEQANIEPIDAYLSSLNQPVDIIFGYVAKGLYRSASEISSSPSQFLGLYGVGDIAYEDLNNDNMIDQRDRKIIGNSFPRFSIGTTLNLKFKGLGLYILGTSALGNKNILNNGFYRNQGEGKYSTLAMDRYHPVNNPGGTQPRLTTMNNVNNDPASTFWMESADYFRLRNVELSYEMSPASNALKQWKFFLRGTNLFVISKNKYLDPEVTNGGVTNYPLYKTVTIGVAINF